MSSCMGLHMGPIFCPLPKTWFLGLGEKAILHVLLIHAFWALCSCHYYQNVARALAVVLLTWSAPFKFWLWISNCFKESLAFARIRMARWSWMSILWASSPHAPCLVVWKWGTSHLFTLIHPVSNSGFVNGLCDLGWLGWGKTGLSHLLVLLVAKLWQQLPLNVKLRFPL